MDQKVKEVRELFGKNDTERDRKFVTPDSICRRDDISYGPYGKWNLMDIYYKKETKKCQKTIVSIHGGAWVYGDKERYQYYCMDLSTRGFTVVNFNYRLAPEYQYPAALEDVNQVFAYISRHAEEYYIDLENLFIVGDSAGAQLASQYLAILGSSDYQKLFAFKIPDISVRAVALNCGIYDVKEYYRARRQEMVISYLGKDPEEEETIDTMKYINGGFPPAFVMTSWCDPLMPLADPMYEALKKLGVDCRKKVYGSPKKQEVGHVFHCNIALKEAAECNDDECAFFTEHARQE